MKDQSRTNQEILEENAFLKQKNKELEQSELERKRAEEEFKQKESLNYALFEYNPEQVIAVDLEGKIIAVNRAKRMSGDRLPNIGDVMYRDYASSHKIDMYSELMECLGSGKLKLFPEQKYRNKFLLVTIAPFSMGAVIISEDITERKRAEEALSKSEEKYRTIIENMEDGYHEVDLKGNFTFFNESMLKILGYERENLLGMNNRQYADEENTRKVYQVYNQVYRTGEPVKNFEWRIIRKDGDRRDIEVSISLIRNTEGHRTGFRGIVRDTTERKRAEKALRESELKYRSLIECSSDAVFCVDEKGQYKFTNHLFASTFGKTPDYFIGKTFWDIYPKEHADQRYAVTKRVFQTGESESVEVEVPLPDKTLYFYATANPIKDETGKVIQILTHATNITERKRAENVVKQEQVLSNTIIDSIPGTFYLLDEHGHYVRWNTYQREVIIGKPEEQIAGMNALETIHPEDRALIQARIANVLQDGKDEAVEGRVLLRGGPAFIWMLMTGRRMTIDDHPFLIGVGVDITERKRAEEELLKADKLESVGILAGGIAHDFNNILTSISGNISMAKMLVKPGDKIFYLLSAAETSSVRAQGLTRQLLTFAKGGTPIKETVFFKKLIKESSLFMLQGSKSVCEFQIAEGLWPVEADVGQISQAISNIVINANQAMPEGGIIQITAENMMPKKIHERPVEPGRYIRISIKDQGIGIVEKHLSKIFDPYFTTKQTGSGLGLATAYSIIKKHNGHISVDSLSGAGTTFHIYLPASDKEIPVKEEAVLLTGCGKILIMDDDEFLKELVKEMLDMLGYESAFAKNGAEAIEMYKKARGSGKPYDAVILDLTIPGGMGGEEVIKILLKIDPEVKAVVCSGYSDSEVMSNYRKYGFKGMMPKPFDSNKLGRVLNDVLEDSKSVKET